ncbi:hypothetical protein R3P38DRAFT_2834433 [Favolaschia claudopus]|uniref:Lysine-specific metallo-endopeptidase domain-containing protein n=1 Tax=Favolaschia claudopus TaxID=2862362 RepID=A0AAW0EDN9_9AGAR
MNGVSPRTIPSIPPQRVHPYSPCPNMTLSTIVLLAFVGALADANPLLNEPSRVARRSPPAPSAYPLDTPCGHEWQYLNFNPDDDTDKGHLEALHGVICSGEMRALSSNGQVSAKAGDAVYQRYFPLSEDDEDTQDKVSSVFALIAGTSSTDGMIGAVVAGMVVDNLDFSEDNGCDTPESDTLGYTDTDTRVDNREKIHFCEAAYALPSTANLDCSTLDPFPSEKMDSFSRVVLHEMTHYSTVGPASELEAQIVDVKNSDGEFAYGEPRVHGLIDPAQDDQPGLPEINADSYAWLGLDAFVSRICDLTDPAGFFTQNPPPY